MFEFYSIYVVGLVLDWIKRKGGVEALQRASEEKARLVYDVIDSSDNFY